MDQIVNNIKFKRNLTYMLRTEKIFNLIIRFSKYAVMCNFLVRV